MSAITVNRELHKGGDRSCMHIELDITGSKLSYVTGDHVAIFPTNNTAAVERIGELLGADLDTVFSLTNVDGTHTSDVTTLYDNLSHHSLSDQASKKHPFPCPTTFRAALTHYVDINSSPRTHVLRELAEHISDPEQKEFLLKMTSPTDEGKVWFVPIVTKEPNHQLPSIVMILYLSHSASITSGFARIRGTSLLCLKTSPRFVHLLTSCWSCCLVFKSATTQFRLLLK